MRVLLLGGTGAMGAHLARILADEGIHLTITSRSRSDASGNVTYIQGNARDVEFARRLLEPGWDCIVDFMVYSTGGFADRVDRFLSSTAQYVYLSSARVFAASAAPIVEDSPRLLDASPDLVYLKTDEYALSKARQENLLFDAAQRNWTIVRPYITYSEDRLQLGYLEKEHWLYRALKNRTILFSREVFDRSTTLTYGYDVARAIAALIGKPNAIGQSFNITTGQSVTWREVLDLYLDIIETKVGFRPRVQFQSTAETCAWYPIPYQITHDRIHDRIFDPTRISEYVDLDSFRAPADGLASCLTHMLKQRGFLEIDWRSEARKDRITTECAKISEISSNKDKLKYLSTRYFFNK